jgi:hypothetical protein
MTSDSNEPTVVEQEPVVIYQSIAVVISVVAAIFGIVVDPGVVGTAITAIVAVAAPLVAAFKARQKVTPTEFPKFG